MPLFQKTSTASQGAIFVGAQGSGLQGVVRPDHALVVKAAPNTGDSFSAFHVTAGSDGKANQSTASEQDSEFLKRSGVQGFEISNPSLRDRFTKALEQTAVKFSVAKVVSSTVRDFFSSEKEREGDVAEKVAKYYHKSHAASGVETVGGNKVSNVFCSQLVYQCLQNAMVEEKLGGEKELGCQQNRRNNKMEIKEDFNTWRAANIDKIREAVHDFPPEMKHISSSVSPKRLIGFLSNMAKEQEVEVNKGVAPAAEEKGQKSQGFFASMKAVISKLVGKTDKGVDASTGSVKIHPDQVVEEWGVAKVELPSVKDVAKAALVDLDLSALRGVSHVKGAISGAAQSLPDACAHPASAARGG
jgi:hypothetical protein